MAMGCASARALAFDGFEFICQALVPQDRYDVVCGRCWKLEGDGFEDLSDAS